MPRKWQLARFSIQTTALKKKGLRRAAAVEQNFDVGFKQPP